MMTGDSGHVKDNEHESSVVSVVNGDELTWGVITSCIVAASGGMIFGYDIVITGGVMMMPRFLQYFYPEVVNRPPLNAYCVYNSQSLASFTSSLYVAGLFASLIAGPVTARYGRKFSMLLGGFTFLVGGLLDGFAQNLFMLILGRVFFGFAIGFSNQATPMYLSEISPAKWRGAFNTGFHLFIGIGNVLATIVNVTFVNYRYGWRFCLGLAVCPALIMIFGVLFIPDSPNSLVQRGKIDEAKEALIRIRGGKGTTNIDQEITDLTKAADEAKHDQQPFFTIFRREYRPLLIMVIAVPFFQQAGGIFVIPFYLPSIMMSVGSGPDAALLGATILSAVNIVSICISGSLVDRCGRRKLLFFGGFTMLIGQFGMGLLFAYTMGTGGLGKWQEHQAVILLLLMCIFGLGFGISWGPLVWVIPSEIFPLNLRPAGQSISVAVNLATTFVLSQFFPAMLCEFRFGAFLFFAGWIVIMSVFVALFLPETKGVPISSMPGLWAKHWFWRRYDVSATYDSQQTRAAYA